MPNLDGPWKHAVENLFPHMMQLLFPDVAAAIDWSVTPQFKDNELPQLEPPRGKHRRGARQVDRLVLVKLLDGELRYLQIHLEIQNQYDKHFTARIYCYWYRLTDRGGVPVTSLAILGDLSPHWRPDCHRDNGLGHQLEFKFRLVKLIDFEDCFEELLCSDNPFALLVAAHLKTMRTRRNPQDRANWKRQLFRMAITKNMDRDVLRDVLRFLDWLMTLPEDLDKQVEEALNCDMKEANMEFTGGIHGTIHILAKEEGLQEGLQKGRQAGQQEGQADLFLQMLALKFGELPEWILTKVKSASTERIGTYLKRCMTQSSLDEIFA